VTALAGALEAPSAHGLKAAFGGFPSGVAAICAEVGGTATGFVVSSFSSGVSMDPPYVLFSVQHSSSTWPTLRTAERIGVSILGADHEHICRRLSAKDQLQRFVDVETMTTDRGAILIAGSRVMLECAVVSTSPAGDHDVVVLGIERLAVAAAVEPLVYLAGRYRGLVAS